MSVQCASPGRGEELVGVCGMCTKYRVKEGRSEQLVGYFYSAPSLGVAYCQP